MLGQTDRAGFRDALEPRGDIDAVSHKVAVALFHDVAEMDANPKLDAPILWYARVALDQAGLHLDRAPDRVDHAAELDDRAVPGALNNAPVMRVDRGIDQVAPQAA